MDENRELSDNCFGILLIRGRNYAEKQPIRHKRYELVSLDCRSAFSTDDGYELRVAMYAMGLLVKARTMWNDYSYISSEDGKCCVKCSVRVYGKP